MKALFIGGTGVISEEIVKLCIKNGVEVTLINRGNRNNQLPKEVNVITCDINNEEKLAELLKGKTFDVVSDFIGFTTKEIERDIRLFNNITKQFIFISSASAYQKPLSSPFITESTPLSNPFWQYSRDKIACENMLNDAYRTTGFPITIIRPSHTYNHFNLPVALHGKNGSFSVIKRIMQGKKVIVPGDGTTLWTLTHSKDFAKAFVGIMNNIHAIGETYHITSDESLTWNQIYDIIGNALGVKTKKVHIASETLSLCGEDIIGGLIGDKSNSVIFDNSKIKKAVPNYCATTRFDQGSKETIDYILSNKEYQKEDPEFDNWCDNLIAHYEKMLENIPKQ